MFYIDFCSGRILATQLHISQQIPHSCEPPTQTHNKSTLKNNLKRFLAKGIVVLSLPAEVDSHGEVSVAAVRVEPIVPQSELDQGDVRGVHALQRNPGRTDVPAGFCDQIFQGFQHLLQDGTLDQTSLKHGCCDAVSLGIRTRSFLSLLALLR